MRTQSEVKLRVFDRLFPMCEPQDFTYQTQVRAEGHELVSIAHMMHYGQEEHKELPLTQAKGIELLATELDEKMQALIKSKEDGLDKAGLEGEVSALVWFFEKEWCECRYTKTTKKCKKCGGKGYL